MNSTRSRRVALFIGIMLVATAGRGMHAQRTSDTVAMVRGTVTVYPTGEPLAGAEVRALGGRHTTTDAGGAFELRLSRGDSGVIWIRHLGFELLELTVADAAAGEVIELSGQLLALTRIPVALPPVDVRAAPARAYLDLVGFHGRKADGFGAFVERTQLEEWRPRVLSDALRRLSGVRISPNRGRGRRARPLSGVDTRQSVITLRNGCEPTVYVDGAYIGDARDFDIDLLVPVSHVEGIEVYRAPGEIPAMFRSSGRDCGVIAFWLRRPDVRRD